MQKQKNNNLKIAIIIIAALVVLAAAVLIGYNLLKKPAVISPTVTVMKYYMGKTIDNSDLKNIEKLVKDIVGNKFEKVEKGAGIVATTDMTGYDGEDVDPGDAITITCAVLETKEMEDIFNMLVMEYGIYPFYQIEIQNIARK